MYRRLILVLSLGILGLGSTVAFFQYFVPQSVSKTSSALVSSNIVDTWATTNVTGSQTVDMAFAGPSVQESPYSERIVDGYWYQEALQYPNCTLSKKNGLLCNGTTYEIDKKILSNLTDVVKEQTFTMQFVLARYLNNTPLPISSRDKTQTIQSGRVFFITDEKYIGGIAIQPNTVLVVVDRKPAIPFPYIFVKGFYKGSLIESNYSTNDFSPVYQTVRQEYINKKTNILFGELKSINGGNLEPSSVDKKNVSQIGTDKIQFIFPSSSDLSSVTNIKASLGEKALSISVSGTNLILSTNKSIQKDTYLPLHISYTYLGFPQSLYFYYKTVPEFSASYQQEKDYSSGKPANKTIVSFSQPVSGSVLETALKSTKIPYQIDYLDRNMAMNYYRIIRYTDPTKTTSIDLSGLRSLYDDTLTKPFIIKIEPYSIEDYQRYTSVVGSPIAVVPQSSEYAYRTQVIAKNINSYDLWLRSCTIVQDTNLILKRLRAKPRREYGEQLLSSLLDCSASKKQTVQKKPFVWRKEYATSFSFDEILGSQKKHPIVEVGVKDLNSTPGTVVLTTDIGVYSHYSTKDNTLYAWMHSLKTSQAKKNLSYAVYGLDNNNKPLVFTGYLETNKLVLNIPKGISVGYLHLYDSSITKDIIEIYDKKIGKLSSQTKETGSIQDQTLVVLSPSYVHTDTFQRTNSFVINEPGSSPNEWSLYAYTDRVLYKPGERIHIAGWLRRADGSFEKPPQGSVRVSLTNQEGKEIINKDIKITDRFGGFGTDLLLPDTASLGFYNLIFSYNEVMYYHLIQVKEFTKPMIFMNHEIHTDKKDTIIDLQARYYFGAKLEKYNWSSDYSLNPISSFEDRSWCKKEQCDSPLTFSYQEVYNSSGGFVERTNYSYPAIQLRLKQAITRPQQLFMNTKLVDTQTQETVYHILNEQLLPPIIVGIKGWSYYWTSAEKPYQLEGEVRTYKNTNTGLRKDHYEPLNKGDLKLSVYKIEQVHQELPGVDGEYYYENKNNYKLISTDMLSVSDGKFSTTLKQLNKNGQYKIEVSYDDIYIAQQYITVYGGAIDENTRYGSLDNSNELTLSISPKEYNPGDTMTVGLDPYIKGAKVLILVKKEGKLLYESEQTMDNPTFNLTVKDSRFPNVYITVMQLVGQDTGETISKKRSPEPRFFVGTQEVSLSKRSRELDIKIGISNMSGGKQEYYTPGQEVKLSFDVQDRKKKQVSSRISVAVVDKSLTDLYDEMKSPLNRFYYLVGQGFRVITNYHFLFKALKVVSNNGQKGGGADGDGSVLNPRKVFLNTAYRNASLLTDKKGNANVSFKLPDNLTTWMVDAVAVGEGGRMGTQRAYFTSSQKYILTALVPQFVDPMTKIRIPVTLISRDTNIASPSDLRSQIKVYASIADKKIPLLLDGDDNRSYIDLDMLSVPTEFFINTPMMKITLEVEQDAIEYNIPIRLESARRVTFATSEGKKGSIKQTLSQYSGSQQNIRVSSLPTIDRDNQFRFMFRYPYGGVEYSASFIDSILLAIRLAKQGLLSTDIIKFENNQWMIFTAEGRKPSTDMIHSTLEKLARHQLPNGLFSYRGENQDRDLSLYVFSILDQLDTDTYPLVKSMLFPLNQSLKSKGTQKQELYYQTILSRKNKIILKTIDELANKKVSYQTDILAFVAKAYQGEFDKSLWERILNIYEENPTLLSDGTIYTNTIPLQSMLIQALLHLEKETEALQLTRDIIKRMDDRGGRGLSTQDTRRGMRAVADRYLKNKINPKNASLPVEIQINGKKILLQLLSGQAEYAYTLTDNDKSINITWSSEIPLFVTSSHTWIERSLEKSSQSQNIRYLDYTQTGVTSVLSDVVGTMNKHSFRFQTKTDASQLVVTATIPSYLRILQGFGPKMMHSEYGEWESVPQNQSFLSFQSANDAGVWYDCTPSHYEQRYDRLVLFYNKLPAGARCDISFMTSKTHDAAAQSALLTVYEMYDAKTFGEMIYK